MRGCEISLVLLALVLCEAPWGTAAPLPSVGVENLMAKIYPRGNHWAVGELLLHLPKLVCPPCGWQAVDKYDKYGHLMGKKSTGDFPYTYEGGEKIPLSPVVPDNSKPLSEYLQWEEMENLLPLLEGKGSRSNQLLQHGLLGYRQPTGDLDSDDSTKNMLESLFQVLNMKESILS